MSQKTRKEAYANEIHTRRERIRKSVDTANNLQRDINLRARRRVKAYLVAQNNLLHHENDQNKKQIKAMVESFQTSIDVLVGVIQTAEENIRVNNRILLNIYPTSEYEQDINRRLNAQALGTPSANSIPNYVDDISARCRNFIRRIKSIGATPTRMQEQPE